MTKKNLGEVCEEIEYTIEMMIEGGLLTSYEDIAEAILDLSRDRSVEYSLPRQDLIKAIDSDKLYQKLEDHRSGI